MSYIHTGNLWNMKMENEGYNVNQSVRNYLKAAVEYPERCGECYLFVYLLTDKEFFINKTHMKIGFVGRCSLT